MSETEASVDLMVGKENFVQDFGNILDPREWSEI